MAGMTPISAYQATSRSWDTKNASSDRAGAYAPVKDQANSVKGNSVSKVETKSFSPIEKGSSLIPQKTEYGYTIGDVQLSDKAADYLEKLKSKFHNMEFITVSKDMKDQVGKNAASYGNSGKMVVLIDDEKLERMATDEAFRQKYEGIIASAGNKMTAAKNSLASTGASIKNFGMTVDSNGNESFFATVEKSLDQQKERIAKKAAEKKELKAKEKKKAQKEAAEERLEKSREEKAQKTDDTTGTEDIEKEDEKEYITFEAKSMDELLSKLTSYTFDAVSATVMTESERMLGTQIDFKG